MPTKQRVDILGQPDGRDGLDKQERFEKVIVGSAVEYLQESLGGGQLGINYGCA